MPPDWGLEVVLARRAAASANQHITRGFGENASDDARRELHGERAESTQQSFSAPREEVLTARVGGGHADRGAEVILWSIKVNYLNDYE
jgi:hypothetical protein